jgi:hypothetical protein
MLHLMACGHQISQLKTLLEFFRSTRYAYACQISQVKTFITFFLLRLIACGHQTSRFKTLLEFVGLHPKYLRMSDIVTQNVYHVFPAQSDSLLASDIAAQKSHCAFIGRVSTTGVPPSIPE